MHYPCLDRCPTHWKRHSQLSRCAIIPGTLRFFPLGTLDKHYLVPGRRCIPRRSQLRKFLLLVALACSIRVTSAITWTSLFPPLLWQLHQNRILLRAFVIDTIITAYVSKNLRCFVFTHVMIQVCCVLPAFHTRQRVQRRSNIHSVQLSPRQRLVRFIILWIRTLALLSYSSPPVTSRACSALCPARRLPCVREGPTTS